MNVTAALYYPHTTIHSESLLKSALLLWDYVECIRPSRHVAGSTTENRNIAEAKELIVRDRIPTDDERHVVHAHLADLLRDGVPQWLRRDVKRSQLKRPYLMYPQKLAHETWALLEHAELAQLDERSGDVAVPPALGLLALSLLADECAGQTRTKITDRERAYSWLFGIMTSKLGGEYLPAFQASDLAATYDRLITASVKVVSTDAIPLKRLIALRKKEQSGKAPELQLLRAKYLATLNDHVKLLLQPGLRPADVREIERQFQRDRQADFRDLKGELGLAARDVLLSREIGVCVLALAGVAAAPAVAAVARRAAPNPAVVRRPQIRLARVL